MQDAVFFYITGILSQKETKNININVVDKDKAQKVSFKGSLFFWLMKSVPS